MAEAFDFADRGLRIPSLRLAIPGDGPQSVADVLDRSVANDPDREALVDRHQRYSYAELDRSVNRAASALGRLGVRPGDRVAVSMGNYTEVVVLFLACMRMGALWVGINRPLAPREKAYILRDAEAAVFLGAPEMVQQVRDQRTEFPELRHSIEIEPGNPSSEWASALGSADDETRPTQAIDPFAPAAIAYTSGTTGFPKGAVHSQHNILLPGAVSVARGDFRPDGRIGSVLPLTILNLIVLAPVTAFQVGCCCVPLDRIDAVGLAEFIRDEGVTHFAGVPTIFHDLLTHPEVEPADLKSLIRPQVGGADCPETLRSLYRERFGSPVTIGYGMTEAPTAVTVTDGSESPVPGLCGNALPPIQIQIRGEDDAPLPPNEVGEICVAPATSGEFAGVYTPMLGYWNQPDATDRALRGDVFHTGDLGTLDENQTLYIRGRRNDLILRGGANVYPAEIERVLGEDPRVAACAVLGKTDERLGERVVAVIQPTPGETLEPETLQAICSQSLARYKVPEEFFFVTQFPRNAMGKIVKRELASLIEGSTQAPGEQ